MAEYKDVELPKKQIADFKRAVNAVKPMNSDYLTGYISALSVVEGAIAEQPTADVVEVVRCKNCKFRKTENCAMYYECECGEQHTWENDDDFCSCGERKELDNADLH